MQKRRTSNRSIAKLVAFSTETSLRWEEAKPPTHTPLSLFVILRQETTLNNNDSNNSVKGIKGIVIAEQYVIIFQWLL